MLNAQSPSDYNKAHDSMKRAYGLTANPTVKADMEMARQLTRGASPDIMEPMVWVILENGLSTKKNEFRIDLPIFMEDNEQFEYMGIALPELIERGPAYENLRMGETVTQPLASMDKIIQAEFKREFPYILGKELARVTVKTIIQNELNKDDPTAGMLASIYQLATTSADIRTWTALPSEFQLARLPVKGNKLTLSADKMPQPVEVELPANSRFNIVYVRAFSANTMPDIQVISM